MPCYNMMNTTKRFHLIFPIFQMILVHSRALPTYGQTDRDMGPPKGRNSLKGFILILRNLLLFLCSARIARGPIIILGSVISCMGTLLITSSPRINRGQLLVCKLEVHHLLLEPLFIMENHLIFFLLLLRSSLNKFCICSTRHISV